jgi:hypothetical protein
MYTEEKEKSTSKIKPFITLSSEKQGENLEYEVSTLGAERSRLGHWSELEKLTD